MGIHRQQTRLVILFLGRASVFIVLFINVVCMITLVPQSADAARRRVVFQLANLKHWADMEYTYEGSDQDFDHGTKRTSQNHKLVEKYHLQIDYAILNQRIANGHLETDLILEQNHQHIKDSDDRTDASHSLEMEYQLDLNLLERHSYPIFLTSGRKQKQINLPFTQNYDLTTSHFSARIALRNQFMPTQLNYRHYLTKTDGLSTDREQTTDEATLETQINNGNFSATRLRALTRAVNNDLEGSASSTETDSFELEADNTLTWDAFSYPQILRSHYRQQRDTGTSDLKVNQWDERFDARLGKALTSGFSYQYRKTETRQRQSIQEGKSWIEHKLFDNLTSRFEYSIHNTELDIGEEDTWNSRIDFTYTKALPLKSRLDLSYFFSTGETDRNFDGKEPMVVDESLVVKLDNNFLANVNIIQESVKVFNADRSILYSEGIDYQLEQQGSFLELVFFLPFPSGGINLGETLSIDYHYRVNDSIEYATKEHSLSASLGLFRQKYRLYGTIGRTDEDLLDGEITVSPLVQRDYLHTGMEANFKRFSLGSSYRYSDSTLSRDKTLEASINYRRETSRSVFNSRLTERYISTKYKDTQDEFIGGSDSSTVNNNRIMFNTDYRMRLRHNMDVTLRGHILDLRGDSQDKNDIKLGALFESRWYKFRFRASADVTWRIYDHSNSREDRVFIGVRRYF